MVPPDPAPAPGGGDPPRTIVKLDGGHSTLIKGLSARDVEHIVRDARADGVPFAYVGNTQYGDNGCIVDPQKVCGIFADRSGM